MDAKQHSIAEDFARVRSALPWLRNQTDYTEDGAALQRIEEQFEALRAEAEEMRLLLDGQGWKRQNGGYWERQEATASSPANNLGTSPAEESGRTEADPATKVAP